MAFVKVADFIKTQLQEGVKEYFVFDGLDRVTDFYTAPVDAITGSPCLRTRYSYVSTSSRVEKVLEVLATWDATWDMP